MTFVSGRMCETERRDAGLYVRGESRTINGKTYRFERLISESDPARIGFLVWAPSPIDGQHRIARVLGWAFTAEAARVGRRSGWSGDGWRMCAKHRELWDDWADFGPHRPMPRGITVEIAASQRDLITDMCRRARLCGE